MYGTCPIKQRRGSSCTGPPPVPRPVDLTALPPHERAAMRDVAHTWARLDTEAVAR